MDLDPRDLRVFLAVERHGSFGRAATALLVSQPTISERVRRLERTVGRELFVRSARGASLTPAAEALLPYARRVVALAEAAIETARRVDDVPALVIAVHSSYAPRVVPLVLGALHAMPHRVTVRDAHSDVVAALVLDGTARVGFAIPGPTTPGLHRVPLRPDPVRCVAAAGHPIMRRKRPSESSLSDSLVALNRWGDGIDGLLARLRRAGVAEWRIRYCADVLTPLVLARDHAHVAFVPESALRSIDSLRVVPFRGLASSTMPLDLLHRVDDRDAPAIRAILRSITA